MSNMDFKTIIGFDESNSQTYKSLRKRIQSFMSRNGIVNRSHAGDEKWLELLNWVTGHPFLDRAQQRVREGDLDMDVLQRAVHFLCLSCSRNTGITSSREILEQELQRILID